jgi:hypothetical protein
MNNLQLKLGIISHLMALLVTKGNLINQGCDGKFLGVIIQLLQSHAISLGIVQRKVSINLTFFISREIEEIRTTQVRTI